MSFGGIGTAQASAVAATSAATSQPAPLPIPPALMQRLSAIPSGGHLAIIPVEGELGERHRLLLTKRLEQAEADGASVILLVLDTPGGELYPTLRMSTRLKQSPIAVIAYVKDQAYSGGAILAVSCRAIIVSRGSAIGDCAPIIPGQTLGDTERAKALAPLLENLRDSATTNGYDYDMLHAMAELGVAWSPATQPSGSGASAAPGTGAGAGGGGIGGLLTLSGQRALDFGLAQAMTDQTSQVIQWIGAAKVKQYDIHPLDNLAYWLTRPWMRGLLLLIAVVGIGLEMQAPGISVPGIVGGLALIALLAGPFVLGLAAWWHLLLFVFGVLLIVGELFLFPGTMAMGIAGLLAMLASLVLAMMPGSFGAPGAPGGFMPSSSEPALWAVGWLLLGSVLALGVLWLVGAQWSKLPMVHRMILQSPPSPSSPPSYPYGSASAENPSSAPLAASVKVGDVGRSLTELRPSGRAVFGDRPIDVVTPGNWIAANQPVKVVELRGHDVVVDRVESLS